MEEILINEEPLVETDGSKKIKDIKKFFDLANDNVKSATEIFNKCVEMKRSLADQTKVLEKQRIDHEDKTQKELEKIRKLKEDIYSKLKEKKADIDKQASDLKQTQILLSNEKNRFEMEKKKEFEKFNDEKLNLKNEMLEKSKELDKVRNEIEKDRLKLEEDKILVNEKADDLAVNLTKFNELVLQFTSGMGDLS